MDTPSARETKLKRLLKKEATIKYQLFQLGQMEIKIHQQTQELLRIRESTRSCINSLQKELEKNE